jgi:hypothetical protein
MGQRVVELLDFLLLFHYDHQRETLSLSRNPGMVNLSDEAGHCLTKISVKWIHEQRVNSFHHSEANTRCIPL